jgi:hypothetical protein
MANSNWAEARRSGGGGVATAVQKHRERMMSTFRIVTLDGGGSMGAFAASVLSTYEEEC